MRLRVAAAVVLAGVLLGACRAEIIVDVNIDHVTGGLVTVSVVVDDDVSAWLPNWAEQIETSDLVAAGWEVNASAGNTFSVQKAFNSQEQLAQIFTEIDGAAAVGAATDGAATDGALTDGTGEAGSGGIFGEPELAVEYEGATSNYSLSLPVNLDHDVADLIDPAAANLFGGNLFGVPTEELERRAGKPLNETLGLVMRASVPGDFDQLPESGALRLDQGGSERLQLSSVFVDTELAEAISTAEQARSDADQQTLLVTLWWLVLASATVVLIYVYVRAVRARRFRIWR